MPVLDPADLAGRSFLALDHASRHSIKVSMTSWSLSSDGFRVAAPASPSRDGDIRMEK